MQSFIIELLITSVAMSVFALFYTGITPLLAKRYSEKSRYYVWLIIVIGLIIPFRPQWGNAIFTVDVPSEITAPIFQIGSEQIRNAEQVNNQLLLENTTPIDALIPFENVAPIIVMPPHENAAPISALHNIEWWQIVAMVWLVGLIAFLAYHVIRHYYFMKMVKRWRESITNEQPFALLQSLKSEMGISQQIGLYECSSIGAPVMIGFIKPQILLPTIDFSQDELRYILKHELVHYKRKDLYYKCLVLIASAIHWFNPIIYMMARAIYSQCESSCDAETIKNKDMDARKHYSETIIGVVRYQSKWKTVLSTNFYGGKRGMKKRIFSIMDTGRKKTGIIIFCVAIVVTFGTGLVIGANSNDATINATIPEIPNVTISGAYSEMPLVGGVNESRSSDGEIVNSPNTVHPSTSAVESWIAHELAEAYAFVETSIAEARVWAAAQVIENRIWAENQVIENRAWADNQVLESGNRPDRRAWADAWIASRYEWAEEWIDSRHEWAEEWIESRYEWADEWIAGRYEWADKMRDLAAAGVLVIGGFEDVFAGAEAFGITFGGSLAYWDNWRNTEGEAGNIYYQGRLVRALIDENFYNEGNGIRFMITSGRRSPRDIPSHLDAYILRDENGSMIGLNVVQAQGN